MPIIRHSPGVSKEFTGTKKQTCTRHHDDFDLEFGSVRYYILDTHEQFKQGKRHFMYGPAVVIEDTSGGMVVTSEYHVNDPHVWSHLRAFLVERMK